MLFCRAVNERLLHVSGLKPTPGPPAGQSVRGAAGTHLDLQKEKNR